VEHRRGAQRQAYAQCRENENTEEVEHRCGAQRQAHAQCCADKTTHIDNYNTTVVILHNLERINVECPECKTMHWIEEKVAGTK
ncbi:13885_t:CDS:2, partial [Gigaspora margarita]